MEEISLSDKMLHAGAYFMLVLLWYFAFSDFKKPALNPKRLLVISLAAFLFGIVIEVLQGALTSFRQPDFYDVLANTAGILIAVAVIIGKNKIAG